MDETNGVTKAQLDRGYARTLLRGLAAIDESRRTGVDPRAILQQRHAGLFGVNYLIEKSAVGTSGFSTPAPLGAAFVREIESGTILARLRPAPIEPLLPVPTTDSAIAFAWTPQGAPARVGAVALSTDLVPEPCKVTGIVVVTRRALQGPVGTLDYLLSVIRRQYGLFLDGQLLNPSVTAVSDQNPASLTSAATPITSAGSSAADMQEDFRRLWQRYIGNGGRGESALLLMSSANAVALAASGLVAFQQLGPLGGTAAGVRCLASDGAGSHLVLLDASRLVFAGDDTAEISLSSVADIEMDDAPSQDGRTGTGSTLVSLWQSGAVAIKIERRLHWALTDAAGCQLASNVAYAAAGSPA